MRKLPDYLRVAGVTDFSLVRASGPSDCLAVGIFPRRFDILSWLISENGLSGRHRAVGANAGVLKGARHVPAPLAGPAPSSRSRPPPQGRHSLPLPPTPRRLPRLRSTSLRRLAPNLKPRRPPILSPTPTRLTLLRPNKRVLRTRFSSPVNGPSHSRRSEGGFHGARNGTPERCNAVSAAPTLLAIHHRAPAATSSARTLLLDLLATPAFDFSSTKTARRR